MVRSINGCPVSEFYKNPYLVSKAEGKEEEEHVISLHNNTSLRMTDLPEELILKFLEGAAGLDRPRRIEDGKEIHQMRKHYALFEVCVVHGVGCQTMSWARIGTSFAVVRFLFLGPLQMPFTIQLEVSSAPIFSDFLY